MNNVIVSVNYWELSFFRFYSIIAIMKSKFSISVKNVRAIKDAEIDLNGITVLSGENGCGKTTISKLLYGFIKTSIDFDSKVTELYSNKLGFITSLLEDFVPRKFRRDLFSDVNEENLFGGNTETVLPNPVNIKNSELYLSDSIIPRIKILKEKYKTKEYELGNVSVSRLFQLYKRHIRKTTATTILELLDDYENYINKLVQEIAELKTTHNLRVYNHQFLKYFNENTEKWDYLFNEFDSNLIDKKTMSVTFQKSFSHVFYIDVPTIFDQERITRSSVSVELGTALASESNSIKNKVISDILNDVLNGKISLKDDIFSRIFMYTSKDGKSIPLSQAASGVKCFAVIERLYMNGYLKDGTLLIVDEPEVHLHPKWIVEYARILVLIHKWLNVTILADSHSPDMVSAIKYISEKEKISDSLTFYIANEVESEDFGKYKYKNLGTDIEEIFSSFNIALDRINQYGSFDDE